MQRRSSARSQDPPCHVPRPAGAHLARLVPQLHGVVPQLAFESKVLKARFESASSNFSFTRCNQSRTARGQPGVNLHRHTMATTAGREAYRAVTQEGH